MKLSEIECRQLLLFFCYSISPCCNWIHVLLQLTQDCALNVKLYIPQYKSINYIHLFIYIRSLSCNWDNFICWFTFIAYLPVSSSFWKYIFCVYFLEGLLVLLKEILMPFQHLVIAMSFHWIKVSPCFRYVRCNTSLRLNYQATKHNHDCKTACYNKKSWIFETSLYLTTQKYMQRWQ